MEQSACADCAPRPDSAPAPDPSLFGSWFEAAHYGGCPGCGGRIRPGDMIRADGRGGWICGDCGSAEPEYQPGTGHAGTLLEQFAAGQLDTGRGVR